MLLLFLLCLSRYVRALGALYMRLVGTSLDCYKYLEPLYLDYRKLKMLNKLGGKTCIMPFTDVLGVSLPSPECTCDFSIIQTILAHFSDLVP